MADEKRVYRRRCLVEGCREYGIWQESDTPPLDSTHPDSHYSRNHAAPRDIGSRPPIREYGPRPGARA